MTLRDAGAPDERRVLIAGGGPVGLLCAWLLGRRGIPVLLFDDNDGLQDDPDGARLVSTGEAARLLGVSQPTLNRAVRRGRLRPTLTTPGGHRRFDSAELSAALYVEDAS